MERVSIGAWLEPGLGNTQLNAGGQERLPKEFVYNLIPEEWGGISQENGTNIVERKVHVEKSKKEPNRYRSISNLVEPDVE